MHLNKKVVQGNAVGFGFFGLLSLVFGLSGLGAVAVIFGVINLFLSLIFFLTKENDKAMTCMLIGAALLVIGFGLCSSFHFLSN
jgi:uncharacterized MnhB-related membrane protein